MSGLNLRSGNARRLALGVATAAALVALAPPAAHAAPFAYVTTGYPTDEVAQFNIGRGGLLAPLSPPSVAAVEIASGIAVSPNGKSVYVTDHGGEEGFEGDAVSQYDVRPDGTLRPKSPFELAAGDGPIAVAVHPDGQSVYAVNELGDSISQYDVGPGGTLSPKAPPALNLEVGEPDDTDVSPDGNSVYVVAHGGVSQFDVGRGGALSPKSPLTVDTANFSQEMAISPDGRSAYVVICCLGGSNGSISEYGIDSGGKLSFRRTIAAGAQPFDVAVTPNGKSAYVIDLGSGSGGDGILQYDIGPTGALSPKSPFRVAPGGDSPWQIVVSPDGKSAYVANTGEYPQRGNISQFDVGADGQLSPKSPATVDVDPGRIALSPPVPTTKYQCRHGGWREFGFESKRRCIRFVKRSARKDCRAEREEIGRQAFREKYGKGKHHRRAMRRCVKQAIGAG